jgi:hypothetical protein
MSQLPRLLSEQPLNPKAHSGFKVICSNILSGTEGSAETFDILEERDSRLEMSLLVKQRL